jgi:hypothetical protein
MKMKCGECNYGEVVSEQGPEHDGSIKCKLTGEEHINIFECNCPITRFRRDKEARLLREKANAIEALEALKHQVSKPMLDARHVIDILTDTTKEAGVKITAAIEYLEDFV